jgi:predicted Zn finger-like uncharacterized protein
MDVRCPQCGTDYVFDERRIGPRGVSVKCTACTHVFRVYRPDAENRPWLIRHPDGSQVQFRDLTILQKWIVEGRIGRRAEISRSGDTWRPLGDISELEPFFKVYEEAEELRKLREARGQEHRPVPATDVVRAMDPIDEAALESNEHAVETVDDAMPTQRALPPRPVTLSQRRHQRSTDLVVGPAPGFESVEDAEEEEPETQPASRPPSAVFASDTLDFADGPSQHPSARPRSSPGVGFVMLVVLLIAVVGAAAFGVRYPEHMRSLLDRFGLADAVLGPEAAEPKPDLVPLPQTGDPVVAPEAEAPAPVENAATPAAPGADPETKAASAADGSDPTAGTEDETAPAPATPTAPGARDRGSPLERRLARGEALLEAGRAEAALDTYGGAAERAPRSAAAHAGKGFAYLALDRPRLARAAFRQARTADATHAETYFGLGEAHLRLGERDAAREAFRIYLKRAPRNAEHRATAQLRLRSLR